MRAGKPQGSVCDKCHKSMDSFERIQIVTLQYEKGEHFAKVSSDIVQTTKGRIDLCEDCYQDYLKNIRIWTNKK